MTQIFYKERGKRKGNFFILSPIYDRFFLLYVCVCLLRYLTHRLECVEEGGFLPLLYFPSSNITARIFFNFNESLKFVKRMNSNYIYGVFNFSKKEACFKDVVNVEESRGKYFARRKNMKKSNKR